jgi:branched-chain amino acid aminotransferase
MPHPAYLWHNGRVVPWEDGLIHVNSEVVLRGGGVFEGIRAYASHDGDDLLMLAVPEHLDRLYDVSMRMIRMQLPWDRAQLAAAMKETLAANEIRVDTHVRVVPYFGEGPDGAYLPGDIEIGCFILTLPRPQSAATRTGVRATISAWRRISDNAMPPRSKSNANYMNSRLAVTDAHIKGFDYPVLLNDRGQVAEGSGQCIFIVRDGVLRTPGRTDGILEGVTRRIVLDLAAELGIPSEEGPIDATELYVAQEAFYAGTAAEVLPISEVDGYLLDAPGPVTTRLQEAYQRVIRGLDHPEWTASVYK